MPPAPIHVFGLGLPVLEKGASRPRFRRLAHPLIERAEVLIGGAAQLAPYAGHPAEKISVGKAMDALYAAIQNNSAAGRTQAVLCGGDPLFYGLGARLAEKFGPDLLRIHPGTSSLQAAAALAGLPWETLRCVSLHGRSDWFPLAHALLSGAPVFALTDEAASPAKIADWMRQRGHDAHSMRIMESLYLDHEGAIRAALDLSLSLSEAQSRTFVDDAGTQGETPARVILLLPDAPPARPWPFGLDDASLASENKLLTKAPVRAAALAALGIEPRHTVWDLGAGSGAVSLEAARLAWQGRVYAVEKHPGRVAHIRRNRRRYGAANLEIIEGEMPACLPASPGPERIFIGGGLGGDMSKAEAILVRAWDALQPGGRMLADCVLLSSLERVRSILSRFGAGIAVSSVQASLGSPLAGDMRLEALNPVFLVLATKRDVP